MTRGEAQTKINKKVLTKGTFQRQMGEMRKKIKSTIQVSSCCASQCLGYAAIVKVVYVMQVVTIASLLHRAISLVR